MKSARLTAILTILLAFSAISHADPITFMKVGGIYLVQYTEGGAQIKIRVHTIDGQWIQAEVIGGRTFWMNMALVMNVIEPAAPQ